MPSNVPTVKEVALVSIIPQLAVMGLLIYVFYWLGFEEPFVYGALSYVLLSFVLRNFVAKHHRSGVRLVRRSKFADAIPQFQKSIDFFTANNWLDSYRYLTLLSSSRMSYKEMGLCNIAFCYSQINNGQKAKEYYERTLQEFPGNGLAIAGLRMISSGEKVN